MIQITIGLDKDAIGVIGNTFLFASVVFSMGAAFHSLLVMSWRRSAVSVLSYFARLAAHHLVESIQMRLQVHG